ncbi:ABC transporter ATP-binding protein [Candidatus Aerophobetes bacterium]|uniref:Nickel import system ATP-binding protein NikD n=1 Tax=Aerophobetes bacterium TaxID=2030807 RepID=A0A523S3G2_UNCAE|nr:MAG: ABC transporter ATP-binding protein [Candidatus Aerophobetes bacterium]
MSNLLEIRDLSVNYITDQGKVKALDKVNLTIGRGSVRAVIGESGCGKTTLARSILGILPSTAEIEKGEVLLQGDDILKKSEKELTTMRGKTMTLIPQDPSDALNPVFTVATQMWDIIVPKLISNKVCFNNRRKSRKKITRMFIDKLRHMQLPSPQRLLNRYPHELSGGQKQRILIGMALILNPLLVVADEPTTSLDVTVEAQILDLLRNLITEYKTSTLYITHNLAVASKISDFITVMYCGQIVESAPSDSFFSNPAHPYSRKLLECLPKSGSKFKDIPGGVPSLIDVPGGCRFHPRCDRKLTQCSQKEPLQKEIAPNHWICCYNPTLEKSTRVNDQQKTNA